MQPLDKLAIAQATAAGISVSELWNHYKATKGTTPKSLQDAALQLFQSKRQAGRSSSYVSQLEWTISSFVAHAGPGKPVSDITLSEVEGWCDKGSAQNVATRISRLRTFLRFCRKRGYCREVLTDRLETISAPCGEPTILTIEQLGSLLDAAQRLDVELLEYLWLAGMLGIRRAECFKLRAGSWNKEERFVVIDASMAKTRSRRLVTVPDTLPFLSGALLHLKWRRNFRKRMGAITSAAGINSWDRNCLRHTAASYLAHYFSHESELAAHLGNSPQMIHRHYRGLVSRRDYEDWVKAWLKSSQSDGFTLPNTTA